MHSPRHTGIWALALVMAAPGLAAAEEINLPFRLVTQDVVQTSYEVPGGHTLSLSQNVGTAVFEDGRIAHKTFVVLGDDGEESGTFTGYSTYTFENGDSLSMKFTGGWSSDGAGGDYEVISGSGAYEEATGTGRFDAAGADWSDAQLWTGQLTIGVPGS